MQYSNVSIIRNVLSICAHNLSKLFVLKFLRLFSTLCWQYSACKSGFSNVFIFYGILLLILIQWKKGNYCLQLQLSVSSGEFLIIRDTARSLCDCRVSCKTYNMRRLVWHSGRLQQPGSSEWCVVETNRQRGNDRLLHNTTEMESTMWRQPVDRNHRRLHRLGSDTRKTWHITRI